MSTGQILSVRAAAIEGLPPAGWQRKEIDVRVRIHMILAVNRPPGFPAGPAANGVLISPLFNSVTGVGVPPARYDPRKTACQPCNYDIAIVPQLAPLGVASHNGKETPPWTAIFSELAVREKSDPLAIGRENREFAPSVPVSIVNWL